MTEVRSPIAEDLERQLIAHLQQDLNRRLNLYAEVVSKLELALMMMNVASSMFLGAEVFAVQHLRDGASKDDLLTDMEAALLVRLKENRPKVFRTAGALRRGEKLGAAI